MATRILVADDHALIRESVRQVIGAEDDGTIVEEAADGQEALRRVRGASYDLVILDISMPGRNGLDVLVELKRERPSLPVLVLSMYPEEQYAFRAYRSGASGYLTKGSPLRELVEAVRKILLGQKYVSATFAQALVSGLNRLDEKDPIHGLSNREMQVLTMIGAGKSVGAIASELALSVKTVSTYRAHILRKMNLKNNAEITRFTIENHLV